MRKIVLALCVLASSFISSTSQAQGVPVFATMPLESSIKFDVEASVYDWIEWDHEVGGLQELRSK